MDVVVECGACHVRVRMLCEGMCVQLDLEVTVGGAAGRGFLVWIKGK